MNLERFSLKGRVAIVTGAGNGHRPGDRNGHGRIGRRVVLAGRTRSRLEETEETITGFGGEALVVETDVSDRDGRESWCHRPWKPGSRSISWSTTRG